MTLATLVPAGLALQALSLSLLIGGLLALGAFTAPVLFKVMPRPEAGAAMTTIFRNYDMVLLVAALGVILGELLRVVGLGGIHTLSLVAGFRYGILLLLTALSLFSTLIINPRMEALQKAGVAEGSLSTEERQSFYKNHKLSENLSKLELLLAVLVLIMTPFVVTAWPQQR
jgi:hypothetical protein